ncbi:MAG TPA: hypothetical protein VIK03_07095 [Thermoleophilia bacterium]
MPYDEDYLEALRKARAEGRTVDIGKAVSHMNRKPLDYAGVDLGGHGVTIFVGEHEGEIRIGDSVAVWVDVDAARRIIGLLGGR